MGSLDGHRQSLPPAAQSVMPQMLTFLTWIGTLCWGVCFVWMHYISRRQDALLTELRGIAKGIEMTTREGHELIKEVHPAVSEIKESVDDVAKAVKKEQGIHPSAQP